MFGSNQAGRHGAGAALTARKMYGAIYGRGVGRQGNCYAIPTKDFELQPLHISIIRLFVEEFIAYAVAHPELTFKVTRIGCGLAGFKDAQIAPLFVEAPANCILVPEWKKIIKGISTKLRESRSGSPDVVRK